MSPYNSIDTPAPGKERKYPNSRALGAVAISTTSGTDWWDEIFLYDMTFEQEGDTAGIGDQPPCLVEESDDEDWHQNGEIQSDCSSADNQNAFVFSYVSLCC